MTEVSGIAPPVAIRQKNTTRNPRSTVATATEIYDYLRLLYARVGTTRCHQCGEVVRRDNVDEIADRLLARPAGARFYVLFQLNPAAAEKAEASGRRGRRTTARTKAGSRPRTKGTFTVPDDAVKRRLFSLRQSGFNRLYQTGRVFEFSTPESLLEIDFARSVYVLVDRLELSPEIRQRLIDSLELCYREGGEAVIEFVAPTPGAEPNG